MVTPLPSSTTAFAFSSSICSIRCFQAPSKNTTCLKPPSSTATSPLSLSSRFLTCSVPGQSRFRGVQLFDSQQIGASKRETKSNSARQLVRCYAEGGSGGDDDDDDLDDEDYNEDPDLMLKEESSGRTLPVGIQCIVPYKDHEYYVCYPMDDPVAFVQTAMNEDEEHETIDDQKLIDQLFPNASAVLSETHIQLLNTPFVLTLSDFSEDPDEDDEDDLDGEGHSNHASRHAADHEHDLDDDEDVDNEVEVVAEFASEGKNYYVVRPLEEVLIIAKTNDGTNFSVIDGKELKQVSPIIEDSIEKQRQETERRILES